MGTEKYSDPDEVEDSLHPACEHVTKRRDWCVDPAIHTPE